jgi:hypothetical protein
MNMEIAADSIISALQLLMLMYFDETICINRRFSCVCVPGLRTSVRVAKRRLLETHQMVGIVYGLLCTCVRYNVRFYAKTDGSCTVITALQTFRPTRVKKFKKGTLHKNIMFCRSVSHLVVSA